MEPLHLGGPIIDLAPGAEENPVAVELADRIRRNLSGSPRKKADFRALRGSILMVAQDRGEALTLRFDHGRLTIHDGTVGIPAVTFCGDLDALRRLTDFPMPWGASASRDSRKDMIRRLRLAPGGVRRARVAGSATPPNRAS